MTALHDPRVSAAYLALCEAPSAALDAAVLAHARAAAMTGQARQAMRARERRWRVVTASVLTAAAIVFGWALYQGDAGAKRMAYDARVVPPRPVAHSPVVVAPRAPPSAAPAAPARRTPKRAVVAAPQPEVGAGESTIVAPFSEVPPAKDTVVTPSPWSVPQAFEEPAPAPAPVEDPCLADPTKDGCAPPP